MNVNVYLPDDLGQRVTEADLPRGSLSRIFQEAVTNELERRKAVSATLADKQEHLIEVAHPDGYAYTGRITGKIVHRSDGVEVYLTDDERLLLHDEEGRVNEVTLDELEQFDTGAYVDAAVALGEKPIIDL